MFVQACGRRPYRLADAVAPPSPLAAHTGADDPMLIYSPPAPPASRNSCSTRTGPTPLGICRRCTFLDCVPVMSTSTSAPRAGPSMRGVRSSRPGSPSRRSRSTTTPVSTHPASLRCWQADVAGETNGLGTTVGDGLRACALVEWPRPRQSALRSGSNDSGPQRAKWHSETFRFGAGARAVKTAEKACRPLVVRAPVVLRREWRSAGLNPYRRPL
jgi:hypothetical protein